MVDIKGLDKARVLKALYDHSNIRGLGGLQAIPPLPLEHFAGLLEKRACFAGLYGRDIGVDLSGDEFDERLYDESNGKGAAQRAVNSIRDEPKGSEDTGQDTDGDKKELTMEEKVKLTKETIGKVLDLLTELPPDVASAASVMLKTVLPGPSMGGLAGMLMMGGPFAPPPFTRFDIRAGEKKERDIVPPFPWDLSSMSRQG